MPKYDKAELGKMAQEYGFVRDTFEKVLRLKEILRYLNEEKYLREHLTLLIFLKYVEIYSRFSVKEIISHWRKESNRPKSILQS